jgi:16S rRNA (adenine1518-N6/adenine1519-N6)-dimethyltransferase
MPAASRRRSISHAASFTDFESQLNHQPRRRFGQHFLTDERILDDMIGAIRPCPGEHILEIGPGLGALTGRLLGSAGALTAIEIDRDLARTLAERFPTLALIQGDALRFDYGALFAGQEKWRIVGNLPYNIATPLMVRLLDAAASIRDMHFLLQKEVVDRLVASPSTKAWGRLSVVMQYRCDLEPLFDVKPVHFRPPPKVHSTFVRISPRPTLAPLTDPSALDTILRFAFSGRRKTLRNALKPLDLDWGTIAIDPKARPDEIDVAQYLELANAMARRSKDKDERRAE